MDVFFSGVSVAAGRVGAPRSYRFGLGSDVGLDNNSFRYSPGGGDSGSAQSSEKVADFGKYLDENAADGIENAEERDIMFGNDDDWAGKDGDIEKIGPVGLTSDLIPTHQKVVASEGVVGRLEAQK